MRTILRLLALMLLASRGWSYTYVLNDNTGLPIKWPPGMVPLRIMLGTDQTLSDGTNYSTSAQAATQTWNAVLGNMVFQGNIAAPGPATDHNHVNELVFSDSVFGMPFDPDSTKAKSILAITTTWYSGNERTESDIIFNTAWTWDSYDGALRPGVQDLQRVAVHELGHSLGLDHPDDAGQSVSAIMNSHVSSIDTPTSDDLTGAQNLYGPPGVPANDNFADAIVLTGSSVKVTGHNTNATKESGEPNHADNAGGHSVWWKWTATGGGGVSLDTRGSYFDSTLAVYTGSALASLIPVASNDDIDRGVVQASSLTFTAAGGTTYYIAVDGFDADSAGITLNLSFNPNPTAPVITTQPVSQTVTAGSAVTFTVAASGTPAPTYQWRKDNANISGATNASFGIASVAAGDAGSYTVVATNSAGSATSNAATLTVNAAPPPPPPTSSGGGGGGAPSVWFLSALSLLTLARRLRSRD